MHVWELNVSYNSCDCCCFDEWMPPAFKCFKGHCSGVSAKGSKLRKPDDQKLVFYNISGKYEVDSHLKILIKEKAINFL